MQCMCIYSENGYYSSDNVQSYLLIKATLGEYLRADVRMWLCDEEADLSWLDAICVSRVDAQFGPAVVLTTVDCNQQDAELSIARPAWHCKHKPISFHNDFSHTYRYN